MPRTLILNQSDILPNSGNSTFAYDFPLGGAQFKDEFVAVQAISLYNSVFNITSINNNNSFSYTWVDGTVNIGQIGLVGITQVAPAGSVQVFAAAIATDIRKEFIWSAYKEGLTTS